MHRRSGKREMVAEVADIYWRAMKQLNTELVDGFVQRFCLFKIDLDVEKNTQHQFSSPDNVTYDVEMDN